MNQTHGRPADNQINVDDQLTAQDNQQRLNAAKAVRGRKKRQRPQHNCCQPHIVEHAFTDKIPSEHPGCLKESLRGQRIIRFGTDLSNCLQFLCIDHIGIQKQPLIHHLILCMRDSPFLRLLFDLRPVLGAIILIPDPGPVIGEGGHQRLPVFLKSLNGQKQENQGKRNHYTQPVFANIPFLPADPLKTEKGQKQQRYLKPPQKTRCQKQTAGH